MNNDPCMWPACVIGKDGPFPPLARLLNIGPCNRCEVPRAITLGFDKAKPEGPPLKIEVVK